ncbi:S8 family serine peptidase [Pelagibacterium luteolum]|uniref:Subtilase family protein n=1 Tax=Pelagibacterium luteolum TaxID=440168 RepID=A0A1G7TQT5_9HYPH|nr:S8 family serine peptidase [Pelagibacterium luteolum]SDG37324.1 Subtilase family protein [Pelagibacterium luteolum]
MDNDGASQPKSMRRRALLARLGLTAAMVYVAPTVLQLSAARASDSVSGASRASRATRPSRASVPSRATPQPQAQPSRPAPARPVELVVALDADEGFALLEDDGFLLISRRQLGLLGKWVGRFRAPAGLSYDQAMARAIALLPVGAVHHNDLYRTSEMLCVDDECAAFSLVGWPQPEPCTAAPVIGMIDTGINPDHEALAGQSLEMLSADTDGRAAAGLVHGTAVAALLIGRADTRTPGLLPNARLVAVDAFHADTAGDAADAYSLLQALDQLADAGVDIINMSFAGPGNELLEEATLLLHERGIALVAAAGNDGPRAEPLYPPAYGHVVAVTAIDSQGTVYRQAVTGEHIRFAAPGVGLWTAASVSGGRLRSGTSYAAPFVTAALAVARLENPDLPIEETVTLLADRAVDLGDAGWDGVYGWGLVDASTLCLLPA